MEGIYQEEFKEKIVSTIVSDAEEIGKKVCQFENKDYASRDRKIDKILTSKKYGIPIMIVFLLLVFWITIVGANYPSQFLFSVFGNIQEKLIEFATYNTLPRMAIEYVNFRCLPNFNMGHIGYVATNGYLFSIIHHIRRSRVFDRELHLIWMAFLKKLVAVENK